MEGRWMDVSDDDSGAMLIGLGAAGAVLHDNQGFKNLLLKAYSHIAGDSIRPAVETSGRPEAVSNWIRAVEVPLAKALCKGTWSVAYARKLRRH